MDPASLDPRDFASDPDPANPEKSLWTDSRFDEGDATIVRDMVFDLRRATDPTR